MNADIEKLYQQIGREAVTLAAGRRGKLLLYAEVEEGVISADLFYQTGAGGAVSLKFASLELQELIMSLWEKWKKVPGNSEWRAMKYVVNDGKFQIDLVYPDQMDADEHLTQRRPRVIQQHFGEAEVRAVN